MTPANECPRFEKCSVNRCPLDSGYHILKSLPDDPQPKCTMERGVRERIAVKYPDILPWGGLTPKEIAGDKREQSLTADQRAARNARLRNLRPFDSHLVRGTTGQDKATPASDEKP